jgi:AAA15 family ATPase/GTPase
MLINFSIQNFGSIKDKQTLSFEAANSKHLEDYYVIETNGLRLLKLGLIYGANASGKTTILKALQFLINTVLKPQEQKTKLLNFEPFLFDIDTPRQDTIFTIDFLQNDIRYVYEIELNKKFISKEILSYSKKITNLKKTTTIFERTTDPEKQLANVVFSEKIDEVFMKTLISNTLWNNTVLSGFLKTNIELKALTDVTNWFKEYLNPVIYTRTELDDFITKRIDNCEVNKTIVLQILKNADFNLSDIIIKEEEADIPKGFLDFLEKGEKIEEGKLQELKESGKITNVSLEFEHTIGNNKYSLPFKQESQGTRRYYGFAGLLYLLIKKSTLFPIDELESSLHPDLFQHFLLSFLVNSKKSQLLATTHSREILNNKDIFRNDVILITDKDNIECATELYSLADFDTSVIRDTSNIYNAYKIGKLGGTPNLRSYYIDIENENE